MAFRKGGGEAEKAQQSGPRGASVRYFGSEAGGGSLKTEDDAVVLRMITDQPDWGFALQHQFIPTKPKPSDFEGNWPKTMPAICQNDDAFKNDDGSWQPGFGNCYICATDYGANQWNRPINGTSIRIWALACVREPVMENGVICGYRDQVIEVTEKDEKKNEVKKNVRNLIVINMGSKNFFSHFTSLYGHYKTVCDRDYLIKVRGEGKSKDYSLIPLDPIPDHRPGSASWKVYEDAIKEQKLDLDELMLGRASKEYFERFFIPGAGGSSAQPSQSSSAPASAASAQEPSKPDDAAIQAMMSRIQNYQP
jgi:hypothetical protein